MLADGILFNFYPSFNSINSIGLQHRVDVTQNTSTAASLGVVFNICYTY